MYIKFEIMNKCVRLNLCRITDTADGEGHRRHRRDDAPHLLAARDGRGRGGQVHFDSCDYIYDSLYSCAIL